MARPARLRDERVVRFGEPGRSVRLLVVRRELQGRSYERIIRFLKDSFALGHKAAATLTTQNMLQTAEGGKSPRLYLATFAVAHAFDHYGQMVEYLRMNGIVPPAGQAKSD